MINSRRRFARALRMLGIAAALALTASAASLASTLTVEVTATARAGSDVATLVRSVVPAPVSVSRRSSRTAVVEVDEAGYERLMADPRFEVVELVTGSLPPPAAAEPVTQWRVNLVHPSFAPRAGVEASVARGAQARASLIARQPAGAMASAGGDLGPGLLEVRLVDQAGRALARAVVADPRIVRSEQADASGQISDARTFIRAQSELLVVLPTREGAVALDIFEPEGPTHPPRRLARLAVR